MPQSTKNTKPYLKQDKYTTQCEGESFGSFFDEDAGADATDSTEGEFVQVQGRLCVRRNGREPWVSLSTFGRW